jgi:hypothetical protein
MPDKGWCRVKKDGKYNFLNKANKPISKMWFDKATQFSEIGVTRVQIGDRCNIIDKNGNLLWDTLVKYWPVGHWGGGRIDSARNVYFALMDINYHENRKKYYVTSDGKLSEVQLPFGKLKNDETT